MCFIKFGVRLCAQGKLKNPDINLRSKGENQHQTRLTYDTGSTFRTRTNWVEGEGPLNANASSLLSPCSRALRLSVCTPFQ